MLVSVGATFTLTVKVSFYSMYCTFAKFTITQWLVCSCLKSSHCSVKSATNQNNHKEIFGEITANKPSATSWQQVGEYMFFLSDLHCKFQA